MLRKGLVQFAVARAPISFRSFCAIPSSPGVVVDPFRPGDQESGAFSWFSRANVNKMMKSSYAAGRIRKIVRVIHFVLASIIFFFEYVDRIQTKYVW